MTPPPERPSDDSRTGDPPRRSTWRERVFVLGGLALALPVTAVSLALGADGGIVGFAWTLAVIWTAAAGFACALRRGFADNDWSAFRGRARRHGCLRHWCLPDIRGESFDWDTRTGAFAYIRIEKDRERLFDDRGHHDSGI